MYDSGAGGASNVGVNGYGFGANSYGVLGTGNTSGVYGNSAGGSGVYGTSLFGYSGYFYSGGEGTGSCSYAGGAGWNGTSDRNKKDHFRPVDVRAVLVRLSRLPVTTWTMKEARVKNRHMGPTAQDCRAAFALGSDDKTINTAVPRG